MTVPRLAFILVSSSTAICALVAARYWYLSSQVPPEDVEPTDVSIDDSPALHILETQVNTDNIRAAFAEASRLNKNEAIWSAAAAVLGAIAAVLSIL